MSCQLPKYLHYLQEVYMLQNSAMMLMMYQSRILKHVCVCFVALIIQGVV